MANPAIQFGTTVTQEDMDAILGVTTGQGLVTAPWGTVLPRLEKMLWGPRTRYTVTDDTAGSDGVSFAAGVDIGDVNGIYSVGFPVAQINLPTFRDRFGIQVGAGYLTVDSFLRGRISNFLNAVGKEFNLGLTVASFGSDGWYCDGGADPTP